jgi:hypothetical protein
MSHTAFRPGFRSSILIAALLLVLPGGIAAQRQAAPASGRPPSAEQVQPAPAPFVSDDANAEQTRQKLNELLEKYPPSLGRVLKLDPSLMTNQAYLAPYPALAAFLTQHPEVAHNPDFFLEQIRIDRFGFDADPRSRARSEFRDLLGGVAMFGVFLVVTAVVVWIIRLIVFQRRWNRMSKVQFDTHAKLLDRFTSNEDLLAYVQTPAGRRFLEATPIPIQDQPAAIAAPLSRILWSVQAGVVLAVGGIGLLYVSTRFTEEASQFFMVIGVITIALGVGFMMSAVAAYVLSRRLGLVESAQPASNA